MELPKYLELPRRSLSYVRCQSRPGKVQRVDEAQRRSTGRTTGREASGKELPEVAVLVIALDEHPLVGVFEGEVQGLRRLESRDSGSESVDSTYEVPDNIRQVSAP